MFCFKSSYVLIIIYLLSGLTYADDNITNLPKCCDLNQVLTNELICTNSSIKHLHYYVHKEYEDDEKRSFFDDCTGTESCIDYADDIKKPKIVHCKRDASRELDAKYVFNKCCPQKYAYDLSRRSCFVNNQSNDLFKYPYIKFGLSQCRRPIVDYKGRTLNELSELYGINQLDPNKYCIDQNVEENIDGGYVIRICHDTFDICKINTYSDNLARCLRKCCPDGYMYERSNTCVPTFNSGLHLNNKRILNSTNEKIGIVAGIYCKKYISKDSHKFYIDEYGYLQIYESNVLRTYSFEDESYCIENVNLASIKGQQVFLCAHKGSNIKFTIARYFLIISCVLLLITIVGYLTLPKLLNLFGKTLICYCSCLLFSYILTLVAQFNIRMSHNICTILAFLIFYSFLMAFSWLNIMSIDIWLTFRSLRSQAINQKQSERKKFIFYNLYAWSIGTIWSLISLLIFVYSDGMPDYLMLRLALHKCFFMIPREYNYGYVIFFVVPVSILIICNCYLFVRTISYYIKVKGEINNMKDTGRRNKFLADKERLAIVLKLFVIMGVLWIFEILTSFYSLQKFSVWKHLETAFDIINASQGIFIFCIFMLKKKVLEAFKAKFGLTRDDSSHSNHTETYLVNHSVNIN